ncbi:MAG TPA: FAD-dependent oxidoreductase [Alphaproteobacteria bacterium]|nr:FAD-dependent oxidoreductase [Alphaproteobacteria bacterium]
MAAEIPSTARVVIVGGGAVGCSALYHLAKLGWTDCVLLEKNELTSGSTWHAAGNCPNFSTNWGIMKLQNYSTRLYARLGDEVGYPMGYHVTGSIRLAHHRSRMEEFHHVTGMARYQGIEFAMLSLRDIKERYPFIELHDLEGGLWDATDGDVDPAQLTQALAKGARDLGARVIRFCPVIGIRREKGEWIVSTPQGDIRAEIVVNAAGYRAPEVGAMVGREVPSVAMSHQYLVTEQISELAERKEKLPLLRDPDVSYYLRQERQGLLLGPYEWDCKAMWLDGVPEDFSFQLWADDLSRLERYIEDACRRVPILGSVGITRVINGPIPYTPDGNPLIGPAPGLANFYEACVFSFGIVQAGGAGKALAEWIVEGEPEWDLWSLDPRRYTGYVTKSYVAAQAIELYQNEYAIGFPTLERQAGRPAKTSTVYGLLKSKGAVMAARGGWERAVWFPRPGDDPKAPATFHHGAWFEAVGEECRAVRDAAGLLDLPGISRFEVSGKDAAAWLDGLILTRLPRAGRCGLGYFLSPKGGVLAEASIAALGSDRYWVMSGATAEWHDRDWLTARLPKEGGVALTNVTPHYDTLVLAGPKSRDILARVTDADLSTPAFPWMTLRELTIGSAPVTAMRMTETGELGYELHPPIEYAAAVYEALMEAGVDLGLKDFGLYALDSLRLEKGYRAWKSDLMLDQPVTAVGMDRLLRLDKPNFVGREAVTSNTGRNPKLVSVLLLVDADSADALPFAIVHDGKKRVGFVTSGGYGHRIGRSLALAFVERAVAKPGIRLQVDIFGEARPASIVDGVPYDPDNSRMRV